MLVESADSLMKAMFSTQSVSESILVQKFTQMMMGTTRKIVPTMYLLTLGACTGGIAMVLGVCVCYKLTCCKKCLCN